MSFLTGQDQTNPLHAQQALHRRQRLSRKHRHKRRRQAIKQVMWHETVWPQEAVEEDSFEDEEKDV